MSVQALNLQNNQQTPPSSPQSGAPSLTQLMDKTILTPNSQGVSLHDQVRELNFYVRLKDRNITSGELLQHFVNNYAIFSTIEHLDKSRYPSLKALEGICRTEKLLEDIAFFERKFHLPHPKITQETQNYVDYIKKNAETDPNFLLPIIYTQYSGLFLGRVVCNATAEWLKKNLESWTMLPTEQRGLSYWNFDQLDTPDALNQRKVRLVKEINQMGEPLNLTENFLEITRDTFQHNIQCIRSVQPDAIKKPARIHPDEAKTRNVLKVAIAALFLAIAVTKLYQHWQNPQEQT